jgi:hypothetical protein
MTPELPHLTPEQKEYLDQQEEARMHRRTAMEAYGEQMAKMFSKVGDEEPDPAKEEMIKQAFADLMCPKLNLPPPGLFPDAVFRRPVPVESPIFEYHKNGEVFVFDWGTLVHQAAFFIRLGDGSVQFETLGSECGMVIDPIPGAAFWKWYRECRPVNERVDAEFKEPHA